MVIFTKVHFQPRLLTRSSLKVALFSFIAACMASDGSEESIDLKNNMIKNNIHVAVKIPDPPCQDWMKTFFETFLELKTKERWFKNTLKTFIKYKENFFDKYKKIGTRSEKEQFVKERLELARQNARKNQRRSERNAIDTKFKKCLADYMALKKDKKRTKFFKKIVKSTLTSYDKLVTQFQSKPSVEKKADFMVKTFKDLWRRQHINKDGIADPLQEPLDTNVNEPTPAMMTENDKDKVMDEGYKLGIYAGRNGPSPSESKIVLHMDALYKRFRDHHDDLLCLIKDKKRYIDGLPQIIHLRCEKCNEDLSGGITFWKRWKARDCKICGRILCSSCSTKVGKRRTCRDGVCCSPRRKKWVVEKVPCPKYDDWTDEETPNDLLYRAGYKVGYDEGSEDRQGAVIYTIKCFLYTRFRDFVQHCEVDENGPGVYIKLKTDRCEIAGCGSKDGLRWKNPICKIRGMNCTTCGRLLCKKCGTRKSGKWCCQEGKGCRWNTGTSDVPTGATAPGFSGLRYNYAGDFADRRMLQNMSLSDSFWQGFFTSMLILLGTFVVYHFMFQKPARSPCRKTYIKKKRSTFFKGRTSEVKSRNSDREVKGVFSQVIRRQLSKLDEN